MRAMPGDKSIAGASKCTAHLHGRVQEQVANVISDVSELAAGRPLAVDSCSFTEISMFAYLRAESILPPGQAGFINVVNDASGLLCLP